MPKFNWFIRTPKRTTQEKLRDELRKWNEEGLGNTAEYDTVSRLPQPPVERPVLGEDIDPVRFLQNVIPHSRKRLADERVRVLRRLEQITEELRKLDILQDAIDKM